MHFCSKRESKGFERTKVWVVFQLLGLSLWGKRERVWREEREEKEDVFVRGFGVNDLRLMRKRLSIRWRKRFPFINCLCSQPPVQLSEPEP